MRAWGLAKGLKANGIDAVVGVNDSFPQEHREHEGIRLVNWSLDEQFKTLINSYDAVIISYCAGDPSVFVADHINQDVQLILDAYVPIYVEVSARESKDIDTEYTNYMADISRFNKVLKRGDYFLCANEAQKTFYVGVLASLGVVNPRSYRQERILVVPFGIHNLPATATNNPYTDLGITQNDFVVLWFGGLYPWFRVEELLGAIKTLSQNQAVKFVFVGGKNPFNPNPDFSAQYDKAFRFAEDQKLKGTSVHFVDWVDFDDRINWYKRADIVISLNQPGEENKYSWRTRVMDYVWGELAIVTNGGDPLSEDLLDHDAAIRLPELSQQAIVDTIKQLQKHPETLSATKQAVTAIKQTYHWNVVTEPLYKAIISNELPYVDEAAYKKGLAVLETTPETPAAASKGKARRVLELTPQLIAKARKKGVLRTAKLATGMAKTQLKKRTIAKNQRRYVFISHPLDNTGAPVVLMQVIKEFATKFGGKNVLVVAPGIQPAQLRELRELNVTVEKAVFGMGFRFIRMQLGLSRNDFVLMNTVAIYDNYRDFIMLWLKSGRLRHAYWFIHEDKAQLPVIHKEFLEKQNLKQVHSLMKQGKLSVFLPSERTKQEYNQLLNTSLVQTVNLRVEVDNKYKHTRPASDYQSIDFLLQGTPGDGRKGHLIALAAFHEFLRTSYDKSPENYRDFRVHFVSIGDDYISQQVRSIGDTILGKRLKLYPSVPKKEVLVIYQKCNAVLCCSLNETFGLYVAEGMFMGHVVLRNNCAGVDEQLQAGVNGYLVDSENFKQFADVIEKVLNKKTSSNQALQKMGQASQEIIAKYDDPSYVDQILG